MIGKQVADFATSDIGKLIIPGVVGGVLGWIGSTVAGWWKMRDRYHAHVTWQTTDTIRGPEEQPVIVIQSIHEVPINVARLRVRNGFRMNTRAWPFDSEDPAYPELPMTIEPKQTGRLWLNEDALAKAAEQSWLLKWLWVPRVYIGVKTLGRGERLFVAEGGLPFKTRRKRYQRWNCAWRIHPTSGCS
jgi:hypothetical protein